MSLEGEFFCSNSRKFPTKLVALHANFTDRIKLPLETMTLPNEANPDLVNGHPNHADNFATDSSSQVAETDSLIPSISPTASATPTATPPTAPASTTSATPAVSTPATTLPTTPSATASTALETKPVAETVAPLPEENNYLDEMPYEVEMSLFDHLEELRMRIFASLIAIVVGITACFLAVKPIVQLLEVPAAGVKFLQLAPGEYFFVSIKVAGYSGLLVASPFILYQIIRFVLPGLTRREQRLIAPVVFGSSILFALGLAFAYVALIPAALNFFVSYGENVVEQLWSIDKYFEFVLLLMFSTGLAFQIPVVQALLGALGIVTSKQMLSGWRFVLLGAAVLGAVLTPSTDPLTQSLLAGAVLSLYFGGIGLVKLLGR